MNPSLVTTTNTYFPLNSLENFISKEIKKPKFGEIPSEVTIKHAKYYTSSFMLKSVQPSVDEYIVGFVNTCENFEELYSVMFVDKFVHTNDIYGFRLLLMEKKITPWIVEKFGF